MKAKDKAKELVNRFMEVNREQRYQDDLNIFEAKQCALICVEKILKELDGFVNDDGYQFSRVQFYKEVKQEINKL